MIFKLTLTKLFTNKLYSALILLSLSLSFSIYLTFNEAINDFSKRLKPELDSSVLVLGGSQNHLDTVFSTLHFKDKRIQTFPIGKISEFDRFGFSLPIFNKYSAHGKSIIGTNQDYFKLKSRSFLKGKPFLKLGECVIGFSVAEELNLTVGDTLISDSSADFDISKSVPVKMRVCGVLKKCGSADDDAIFTNLKTAWTLEGIGHEHKDDEEATTALVDLTKDKLVNFHFHGEESEFPVTSALLFTKHKQLKAEALALGQRNETPLQIIDPHSILKEVHESISGIHKLFYLIYGLVATAVLLAIFVFMIQSIHIRKVEKETYEALGLPATFHTKLILGEWIILSAVSVLFGFFLSLVLKPIIVYQISNLLN